MCIDYFDHRNDDKLIVRRVDGVEHPEEQVMPLGAVKLAGRTCRVPQQPAEYLQLLYGYTGAFCIHEGNDCYRPCRSLADYAAFTWNVVIYSRIYFIAMGPPLPKRWLDGLWKMVKPVYNKIVAEPKL